MPASDDPLVAQQELAAVLDRISAQLEELLSQLRSIDGKLDRVVESLVSIDRSQWS